MYASNLNKKNKEKCLLIFFISLFLLYLQLRKNIIKNKKSIFPSKLIGLSDIQKKLNLSLEFMKTYVTLFFVSQEGLAKEPINSLKNIEPFNIKHRKGVGICSIGKKENLYAKEFVEYYMKLGIKKIIIYDNNEIGGEKFEDALKEYIINEKVEIIDIRGFESVQFPSYMNCYKKYGEQFDFLLFLDFDEFIHIENKIDINSFLYNEKFKKCETIVLNWVMFGDNDLIKYDNRTMIERFTKPIFYRDLGKSIVRANISQLIIPSSHIIGINTKYFCDSNGNRLFPSSYYGFEVPIKPEAYIKHFYTKTAEEFCNKINKGDVQFHENYPKYLNILKTKIETFFTYNSITNEKLNLIENCSGMNLNKYRNKKLNKNKN